MGWGRLTLWAGGAEVGRTNDDAATGSGYPA